MGDDWCVLRSWLDSGYTPMRQSTGTLDCISHHSYAKVDLGFRGRFSSISTCPLHLAVTCPVSWSPEEHEIVDFTRNGFRKMFFFSASVPSC